jgi:hypothetical protein
VPKNLLKTTGTSQQSQTAALKGHSYSSTQRTQLQQHSKNLQHHTKNTAASFLNSKAARKPGEPPTEQHPAAVYCSTEKPVETPQHSIPVHSKGRKQAAKTASRRQTAETNSPATQPVTKLSNHTVTWTSNPLVKQARRHFASPWQPSPSQHLDLVYHLFPSFHNRIEDAIIPSSPNNPNIVMCHYTNLIPRLQHNINHYSNKFS